MTGKYLLGLDCKIFTVLHNLFINYGPQSQFRFLLGNHLSLDLSIFALVAAVRESTINAFFIAYFAIVPFLEYSKAASYINRCIYQ